MIQQNLWNRAKRRYNLFINRVVTRKFAMSNAGYYVLGAFGGYILTSVFLLKCPILYKKKRLLFKCSHISHRGGAAEKLENTCDAYQNAIRCGTQMLELDVHLTSDKIVVVSHDDHLLRTTGEDIHIKDTRFEDLPLLQTKLSVTFETSTICHHEGERLKIEKLEDVFQQFPKIPIHLDVKTYDEELMAMTDGLIKKYNREEITPWGNFSDKVTSKLYKTNPNIPLVFSMKRVVQTLLAFYTGLLPFLPIKESSFAIVMPNIAKKLPMMSARKWRIAISIVNFLLMSKVLFKHLTDRGINVYIWVLNEEKDFETAFKLGATGVMTDFPQKLREFLDQHPQYQSDC